MFAKENKLAVGPYVVVNTEFHYYYYYYYYTRLTSFFPIPKLILLHRCETFLFQTFWKRYQNSKELLKIQRVANSKTLYFSFVIQLTRITVL